MADILNYLREKNFLAPTIPLVGSEGISPDQFKGKTSLFDSGDPYNDNIMIGGDLFKPSNLVGENIDIRFQEPQDINSLFQPETEARDAYTKLLGELPQREKPSFGRKLAASLVAAGPRGPGGALDILDRPYNQKMEEFKIKSDILKGAMTEESRANRDAAAQLMKEVNSTIAQQKLELDRVKNQQIYETKQREIEDRAKKAEADLKLAYDRLAQNAADAEARRQLDLSKQELVNARNELNIAQRDRALEVNRERLEEAIRHNQELEARAREASARGDRTQDRADLPVTTEVNLESPTRRVTTQSRGRGARGSRGNMNTPSNDELVEVFNPQGKRVKIRKNQLPEAVSQGYKEIR